MKRILICTSVLGGGTALVFAAAALAATIAPAGQLVPGDFQQAQMFGGIRGGGPLLVGNGGAISKVIGPDGSVTVTGTTTVNIASDLPAIAPAPVPDPPVIVQPVATQAP